jgi:hypothetical protein
MNKEEFSGFLLIQSWLALLKAQRQDERNQKRLQRQAQKLYTAISWKRKPGQTPACLSVGEFAKEGDLHPICLCNMSLVSADLETGVLE